MFWRSNKKNYNYSYFSTGVELNGCLRFQGVIRLDGRVKGEIISSGTLVAEEISVIHGDILVENLVLSGTVYGNITATKQVHLSVTAKVYGDISYGDLSIEVGALHEGSSHKLTKEELGAVLLIANPPEQHKITEEPVEKNDAEAPSVIVLTAAGKEA